ncbi:hypothetical protein SY88_02500 [Clostridiales bacterium PH28_bin88]|nr:hypothetical protein SY88_02500 [Clostridiales bacterium PH28_bin88]
MSVLESIRVALEGIWVNKLRSLLTMLGIIIGIAAVIAVVAIGQGGRSILMTEMEKIGSNLFVVYVPWDNDTPRRGDEITVKDAEIIKDLAPAVKLLAPSSYVTSYLEGSKTQKRVEVQGTTADYAAIRNVTMARGRFFSEQDTRAGRRVAVIDEELAEQLFGQEEALGKLATLGGTPVLIVGIAKTEKNFLMATGQLKTVYIPITFYQYFTGRTFISAVEGQAASRDQVDAAMEQTVKILERRHNAKDLYKSASLEKEMAMANKVTGVMQLIIMLIASISLVVGGIGVMNIMLVSVTERTREIGIRKALGASRANILSQFLIEAVTICLVGGLIGTAIGVGGAFAIAKLAKWPPLVSWVTIMIAVIFSTGIGITFGLYPANKASKMDPIEALRYE